jgi:hypothetical protein
VDWKGKNYVNPPFHGETIDGKRYAMTAWVRKAIEEQGKGKTSVLVFPQFGWFYFLLICHTSMEGRNLTNVWNVSTGQTSESHYAVFPSALIERPVAMSCPLEITAQGPKRRRIEMCPTKKAARSKGHRKIHQT